METEQLFIIPDALDGQGLIERISGVFTTRPEPACNRTQRFYDTFDWRLYGKGLILSKEAGSYCLRGLENGAVEATAPCVPGAEPRFWQDFPEGPLRDRLQSCLDVRALLPLVTLCARAKGIRILNEDEKTVLRVQAEDVEVHKGEQNSPLARTVTLRPVRGYRKHLGQVARLLNDLGAEPAQQDIYRIALAAVGKTPGDYSSKLDIRLEPDLPAHRAARQIHLHLLQTIRRNEDGLREDIDTEFLHDFRVAVRRTRSALGQIKGVFPKEAVARFRRDFSALGKLTNRLRDLDVYLLKQDHYGAMLPPDLRPELAPLFERLQDERSVEHRKLCEALSSPSYGRILADWEAFLNRPEMGGGTKHADRPAIDVARRFIFKQYGRVIARGKAIDDTTPDEELHRLRIECKKLRYLLEFFASLFPPDEIRLVVQQLKALQDNLGDFNDLSVQQEDLKAHLDRAASPGGAHPKMAAAIGGLIAVLYQKQQDMRRAFGRTFDQFGKQEVADVCQSLFAGT